MVYQTITFSKADGSALTLSEVNAAVQNAANFGVIASYLNTKDTITEKTESGGTVVFRRVWQNDAQYSAYLTDLADVNTAHRDDLIANGVNVSITAS